MRETGGSVIRGRRQGAGRWVAAAAVLLGCAIPADAARAPYGMSRPIGDDEITKRVKLEQRIDNQLPLELPFTDETGKQVRLGDVVSGRPVLLTLIQYRCTMLCSEEMNTLLTSLRELKFNAGREFDVVVVTIDPREGPELAAEFKKGYLERYGRPGTERGWHVLTGSEDSVLRLADAIGFHFVYNVRNDQFAHPDGVIVVTPEGKVARYFFRLLYPARDLRLAIVEAARNRVGTPLDALALLCYHYDPVTGTYALAALALVRLGGIITVLCLAVGIGVSLFRDRRARIARQLPALRNQG